MQDSSRLLPRAAFVACALAVIALATDFVSAQGRRAGRLITEMLDGHEVVAGEVLLRFRDQQRAALDQAEAELTTDADDVEFVGRRGLRRLHSRRHDTRALIAMLRANPEVELVEPNYVIRVGATPNDPRFNSLWGLRNAGQVIGGTTGIAGADISATFAWELTKGSRNIVVGVVDTGIDYNHPDLAANIWSAPGPFTVNIGGTLITCAAGTHGFNAITNTCDPMDDHNHGTHVAGTIGAVGNNGVGVAGVNWVASMMGLKFLNASGSGTTANFINVIDFAVQAKAAFAGSGAANIRVLNNSAGGGGFSQAFKDAIDHANASDMLFVAAAGNNASNNDAVPFYPASYPSPNVIAVAATSNRDLRASFSNWGATSVHLGAPGVSVLSTIRNNNYDSFSGTSMATPHVAGAAALVLAGCPATTTSDLKTILLTTADPIPALASITIAGGRLNVYNALRACRPPTGRRPGDFDGDGQTDLAIYRPSNGTWYTLLSGSAHTNYTVIALGNANDIPVPGDYDGDGVADIAVYRPATFTWDVLQSSTYYTTSLSRGWGGAGAVPVPADYDGDGATDIAVWWSDTGEWWTLTSSSGFTAGDVHGWGSLGDVPVPGDYDGDGLADPAIYRPASGQWWILRSATGYTTFSLTAWGVSTDITVPGDFDGDRKFDLTVYRPSTGTWFSLLSSANYTTYLMRAWGTVGDVPVMGDYDGDGKADLAVFRPSTGVWWVLKSSTNYTTYLQLSWGLGNQYPPLRRP